MALKRILEHDGIAYWKEFTMRPYLVIVAVLLAWLALPHLATAKSLDKQFIETLSEREDRYASLQPDAVAKFNAAMVAIKAASENPAPTSAPDYGPAVLALGQMAFLDGRWNLLHSLRAHLEKRPSDIQTEIWFQERANELRTDAETAKAELDALRQSPQSRPFGDYLHATGNAVTDAGRVRGKIAEMELIDQNMMAYLQAKGSQDVRRQAARSRFFAALGAAGAAMRAAQPPPPPPVSTWSATCNTSGNFTRCSGVGH